MSKISKPTKKRNKQFVLTKKENISETIIDYNRIADTQNHIKSNITQNNIYNENCVLQANSFISGNNNNELNLNEVYDPSIMHNNDQQYFWDNNSSFIHPEEIFQLDQPIKPNHKKNAINSDNFTVLPQSSTVLDLESGNIYRNIYTDHHSEKCNNFTKYESGDETASLNSNSSVFEDLRGTHQPCININNNMYDCSVTNYFTETHKISQNNSRTINSNLPENYLNLQMYYNSDNNCFNNVNDMSDNIWNYSATNNINEITSNENIWNTFGVF